MNIRKTIASWLFRAEYDRLREVIQDVSSDWQMIPYLQARQAPMMEMLSEFDSQLYDLLVTQLRDYQLVTDKTYSDQFRLSVVRQSRSMYLTSPVPQFAVELWTDYAFGSQPNLTAINNGDKNSPNEPAQALWDEFFTADRNAPVLGERKLHKLSETVLVDGEAFFAVFASTLDGEATVRTIPTEQIVAIIHDPVDASIPLYYQRSYTDSTSGQVNLYYPDWHATEDQIARAELPPGAVRADKMTQRTDVVMLHAAYREVNGRGWPLATAGIDWTNEYDRFLKNRAAVARAAATWVEKIKAKGGQRAIDAIKSRLGSSIVGGSDNLETNPPPAAGSTWIENDALSREWMNRPTGASDAEKDGMPLLTQAGLALKLYPHYLGRGEVYRLATSTAMEGPTLKSFNRYQAFWSSVWRDLFSIVIDFAQEYGGFNGEDVSAQVSTDLILDVEPDQINATAGTVNEAFDRGLLDTASAQAVTRSLLATSLTSIGVQGVDEMLNPQTTAKEAATSANPFDLFVETEEQYRENLRAAVYGLWSGKISADDFTDAAQLAIDVGIRDAWKTGLADVGLTPDDMTEEEATALSDFILEQYGYLGGFMEFILANSKAAGGKLATVIERMAMWVSRWQQARARAMLLAKANPPLIWQYGDTVDHCKDCSYAAGKVYRASVWRKWGWEPKLKSLSCHGYQCDCRLNPVPKGTKLTRGHPRRLV